MATKENVFVNVVTEFNGKALLKGQKQLSSFDKTIKNLGKSFATVFGAQAILNFSKNTINAFMKDEAAAKSLATQLKNMGFGFAATEVEGYIANLEKSTGVLDDHLRPALQTLITATGSLTQSQKALSIALDVSAATGKSVEEVSMALAKGFSGQTTAISRLGAGIDAATLKTGDMNKIMGLLQQKFAGQAKARLTTYAGKMDLLQGAAARASETIGKSLLDSISALSGDTGIQGAADAMESLATQTANTVYGFSLLIAQAKKLVGITGSISKSDLFMAIPVLGSYLSYAQKKGANARAAETQTNVGGYSGIPTAMEAVRVKEWMAIKKAIDLRNKENAALTKKTAVDQLKDKFDLERIGLTAALNSATDEETKLRLKSQLAILDNNEALSRKYLAEMNAAEAAKKLAADLTSAGDTAYQAFNGILNLLGRGGDQGPSRTTSNSVYVPPTNPTYTGGGPSVLLGAGGDQGAGSHIQVYVDAPNVVDTAGMARVVQQALLEINKNGYSTVPAGQGF